MDSALAITVVVPMYNCEAYADEQLVSLSKQTFEDFEVICVDDGSTDATLDRVKEFCAADRRFRYITKENGGAGSARNAGLDAAVGKYVIFLDADDAYSERMLEELYSAAGRHDADITICKFYWQDDLLGQATSSRGLSQVLAKSEGAVHPGDIPHLFTCTNPSPINKLYRRDFLDAIGLRYTTRKIAQDLTFTFSALPLANRIVGVDKELATVRTGVDNDSITSGRHKHALEALSSLRDWFEWLDTHHLAERYEEEFLKRCRDAIVFETNFSFNEEYLSQAVRMMTHEDPWTHFTHKQVLELLDLDSAAEQKNVEELEQQVAGEPDSIAVRRQLAAAKNRLASMRFLEDELSQCKPEISIIIPIYNSEACVHDLVGQIAAQSFTDFEAIFVDDGSTDGTLALLGEECAQDARLTCIAVDHAGAGAARNTGLDAASGTYIMFFDADDEYSPDLLQEMHDAMMRHQVDEVFCLYSEKDYSTGVQRDNLGVYLPAFPNDEPVRTRDLTNMMSCTSWRPTNILFKKDLIDAYQLRFSTTKVSNDLFFIYAYAATTQTMACVHKQLLTVRRLMNSQSLTSSRWKHTEDAIASLRELYAWLEKNDLAEVYRDSFLRVCFNSLNYNTGYPYNQKYIDAATRFLCCERPWVDVENEEFYGKYWRMFDRSVLRKSVAKCQNDPKGRAHVAQRLSNQLLNIRAIEDRAFEEYGRVLNPNSPASERAAMQETLARQEAGIKELEGKVSATQKKIAKLKSSTSFRVGKGVTWAPRKIKRLVAQGGEGKRVPIPKISVIVPFYNAESYIGTCLDSLVAQTLKELEFIFVDDGSTDGSVAIIEERMKIDGRIKLLRNAANLGPGAARNKGVDHAQGEYVAFLDADDWLDEHFYKLLYRKAQQDRADIVKGAFRWVDENGHDITPAWAEKRNDTIQKAVGQGLPLYSAFDTGHWSAIYKLDLFEDGKVRYGKGKRGEDGVFLLNVGIRTSNIAFADDAVYYRLRRSGSLSATESFEAHMQDLDALEERIDILLEKGFTEADCAFIQNRAKYYQGLFDKYLRNSSLTDREKDAETAAFREKMQRVMAKVPQ